MSLVRQVLAEALRVNGVCGDCRFSILLTVSEACTNAVEHGAPAVEYEVTAEVDDESCLVEIADSGSAFTPERVSLPDAESESGRGILLMRYLADEVRFLPAQFGGTTVRLRKWLHNGDSHEGVGCGAGARIPAMLG
ncbi:ATP-binding protein [Halostreptopolyspora alba]|uniref:ATP-binding protein n=1 Tax=Halostreptopolyspora alba TaxID=2487137 RepID=UPI00371B78F4